MALQLGVDAPAWASVAVLDEPVVRARPVLVRAEPVEAPPRFVLACRDVIDEVRSRMDRRGFHWE